MYNLSDYVRPLGGSVRLKVRGGRSCAVLADGPRASKAICEALRAYGAIPVEYVSVYVDRSRKAEGEAVIVLDLQGTGVSPSLPGAQP